MNNFSMSLKKMFSNKNFVTAICFMIIGVVLIVGYNWRVESAINPIKVPYATKDIPPRTKITPDYIDYIEVARDSVNEEYIILNDQQDIVNKYSNLNSTIYKGSFFYKGAVVEKNEIAGQAITEVKEGLTPLTFKIDMFSSYYNSLVPGDYFDLYVRTIGSMPGEKNKKEEIIVGKLVENIMILAVTTSDGKPAHSADATGEPEAIQFAVPEDIALLILKAQKFSELTDVKYIEFIIVPRGNKFPGATDKIAEISSAQLEEYINDKTKDIKITTSTKKEG